jgi:hypothetical protein
MKGKACCQCRSAAIAPGTKRFPAARHSEVRSGSHDARTQRPPETNVPSLCGQDGVAE